MKVPVLDNIINGRTVAICAHGISIETLENRIEEFKDYDICWASLNLFTIVEDNILNKIGKRLDLMLDTSTIAKPLMAKFERDRRIPRLTEFLSRGDNNMWLTTEGLLRDQIRPLGYEDLLNKYWLKILALDKIYSPLSVPNSISLLLCAAAVGGARNIVLFGYDGYWGTYQDNISSYYKSDEVAIERQYAVGNKVDSDVAKDTVNFNRYFWNIYQKWCSKYEIKPVDIFNCSTKSLYDIFPKVTYDQVHQVLADA